MEIFEFCNNKISEKINGIFNMAIGKFNMKDRQGQISLCHCEEGVCSSRQHLRRTAFVAVQVSNPLLFGDCFVPRNDISKT